jgi:hypothetical protein
MLLEEHHVAANEAKQSHPKRKNFIEQHQPSKRRLFRWKVHPPRNDMLFLVQQPSPTIPNLDRKTTSLYNGFREAH